MFEAAAARVRRIDLGRVLSQPEVAISRDLNQLLVEGAEPELDGALLAAVGRRLRVRQVEVWDEATAERVTAGMEAAGWEPDSLILLAAPREIPGAGRAQEVAVSDLLGLREEWLRDTPEIVAKGIVEDLQRADALLNIPATTRAFLARSDDGAPAAMALLQSAAEGMALIEDVYTTPAHRRKGLGRATVATALAAGRAQSCSLISLNTDVEGPARRFYSALGFTELGLLHRFFAPEPPASRA